MPNISSNQGMGQYRYDKNYSYIINKTTFGIDIIDLSVNPPVISKSFDIKPTYRNQGDSIVFRDIQIPLTSNIQYGKTYYLHLDLPQHIQYTTTVRVKLCTYDTSNGVNYTNASLVNFQTIRELIIPPAPPIADQDAIENILLYVDPISNETSPLNMHYQADIIYDWPDNNGVIWKPNNVYTFSDSDGTFYYKSTSESQPNISDIQKVDIKNNDTGEIEISKDPHIITDYVVGKMEKRWLTANSGTSIASFDIVFSPTYNLLDGYSFILLEIDRSGGHQTQIQYIGTEDGETYYGTYMALKDVSGELYEVPNLLTGNTSNDLIGAQIKSATGTLNHIAVWSHPELLLAINGEEIKIGQSNFYELDDFTITSLGVVAKDSYDRFTIDYQYQVS